MPQGQRRNQNEKTAPVWRITVVFGIVIIELVAEAHDFSAFVSDVPQWYYNNLFDRVCTDFIWITRVCGYHIPHTWRDIQCMIHTMHLGFAPLLTAEATTGDSTLNSVFSGVYKVLFLFLEGGGVGAPVILSGWNGRTFTLSWGFMRGGRIVMCFYLPSVISFSFSQFISLSLFVVCSRSAETRFCYSLDCILGVKHGIHAKTVAKILRNKIQVDATRMFY